MDLWKISLPNRLEIYQRDDQVILFNLENMSFCRLNSYQYSLLNRYIKDKKVKESLDAVDSKTKNKIISLIFKLFKSGIITGSNSDVVRPDSEEPQLLTLFISLTKACNLECKYCYADGGDKFEEELSTERIIELIGEAKNLAVRKITFTGGEPLLRKDFFKLAQEVKRLGMKLEVITNGLLINKKDIDSFDLVDKFVITLDGSTPEIHDSTRGEGTFDSVLEAIKIVKKTGKDLVINTIVNKNNCRDIFNIVDLVGGLGVYQHNTNLHLPIGRGKTDGLGCSPEEIKKSRFQLARSLKVNLNRDYIMSRINNSFPLPNIIRTGCGAAVTELYVNYDGSVYPCRLMQCEEFDAGNVKESTLKEILEKSKIIDDCRELYKLKIKECQECNIYNYCVGGCRAMHYLYTGDLTINHKNLCDTIKEELELNLWLKSGYVPDYFVGSGDNGE